MKYVTIFFCFIHIFYICIAEEIDRVIDVREMKKINGQLVKVVVQVKNDIQGAEATGAYTNFFDDLDMHYIHISPGLYSALQKTNMPQNVEQYKTIASALMEVHNKTYFALYNDKVKDYLYIKEFCYELINSTLTDSESRGVIADEEGHIVLNHAEESSKLLHTNVQTLKKQELEADAYAVKSSLQNAKGFISFLEKACYYDTLFPVKYPRHPNSCKRLTLAIKQMHALYPDQKVQN
ncbi:MAG TPA: hypothetical protein VGW78_03945 [Candidatus Babeliales bacterium]|jgi:hypothetical protein|nr:hypothetical protein [Candidatus Babeliales bacterium]